MKYNFTSCVNRKNKGSFKWNDMFRMNKNVPDGIPPLSVADMEFNTAPEIIDGLKK